MPPFSPPAEVPTSGTYFSATNGTHKPPHLHPTLRHHRSSRRKQHSKNTVRPAWTGIGHPHWGGLLQRFSVLPCPTAWQREGAGVTDTTSGDYVSPLHPILFYI